MKSAVFALMFFAAAECARAEEQFSIWSLDCAFILALEDNPEILQPEFRTYLRGVLDGAKTRVSEIGLAGPAIENFCKEFAGSSIARVLESALANDEIVAMYAARTDEVRMNEALAELDEVQASSN